MDQTLTFSSHRWKAARIAPLAALLLVLGGCNSGGDSASGGKAPTPGDTKEKLTVGIVFDSGGRGDKSFNDSAYAGIERAEKDFGVDVKTVDSKKVSDYPGNLSGIADQGAKVVFAVGITQQEAMQNVADKYPDVKFGIIDARLPARQAAEHRSRNHSRNHRNHSHNRADQNCFWRR